MPRRLLPALFAAALLASCAGQAAAPAAPTVATTAPAATAEVATAAPAATAEIAIATATAATAEVTTEAASQSFPITIKHEYGSTTIPAEPKRVLSLGYSDQDAILALGVVPVAVRYWFGDEKDSVWPWAKAKLGGQPTPPVLNMPFGELNIEAIAALKPDLIIAVSAGLTDKEYATLAQIAPTVPQTSEYVNFGVPWQAQTKMIGKALGKEALANELVAKAEAQFDEVRAAHPEFAGKTITVVGAPTNNQFMYSASQDVRMRFPIMLGFTLPAELDKIANGAFYGTVSAERIDLIDTDVVIWTVSSAEERKQIESNPLYAKMRAAKEGRSLFLDTSGAGDITGPALVYSSVLSLPAVFEGLVPRLQAALDGDPATSAE